MLQEPAQLPAPGIAPPRLFKPPGKSWDRSEPSPKRVVQHELEGLLVKFPSKVDQSPRGIKELVPLLMRNVAPLQR